MKFLNADIIISLAISITMFMAAALVKDPFIRQIVIIAASLNLLGTILGAIALAYAED